MTSNSASATVEMQKIPRWDLSSIYPGLDSPQYREDFARYERWLGELEAEFDRLEVRRSAEPLAQSAETLGQVLETLLPRIGEGVMLAETLDAFVYGLITTNSYDAEASREYSKFEMLDTRKQKLFVRLRGWIGGMEKQLPAMLGREALKPYEFFLRESARKSKFLMPEALEDLAAELCVDGASAFSKLQGNVTSQLKMPFERDGRVDQLPMTMIRNLAYDPDPAVRERAYRVELQGWESVRTTVAACLNSIKGTALTLAKRRGRTSVLEVAMDDNRVDRATLDAMMGAIREAFPMFRRYLQSKARKLGKKQLPWWDLFAPVGSAQKHFDWSAAREFVVEKFSTFSDDLGQFAATAFDKQWIDAEPRDGKRGGAYCMPVQGREESRVMMNFDGSFEQLMTLAHELGHGYHNACQTGLPMLLRGAPSTLAETASIFCETLVAEAAIAGADDAEKLVILEAQIAGATQVCLDISSRFIFESAVLEGRKKSELGPDELCQQMLAAQKETYADGLDPATYHPYMWVMKPHYYNHDHNFYNFPYAFGHLFGLGLFAIFQREGADFVSRYKQLLRDTGCNYAAPLASRFGIDITKPDFWRASLRVIDEQVERYEAINVS